MQALFQRITAFFMSILTFFAGLFGINIQPEPVEYKYGPHERHVVDIALPRNAEGSARGLILYIHGGAWIGGDKSGYSNEIKKAATKGYVAAAMNYRYISDTVHSDDIMDDITAALAKIKEVAAEQGITVNKALLTGASAGAHLSLLYAYSRSDAAPVTPAAVVSFCGPTELSSKGYIDGNLIGEPSVMLDLLSKLCGVKLTIDEFRAETGNYSAWAEAIAHVSPASYVTSSTVPTVIAHGEKDSVVPFDNAVRLDALLTEAGVKHDFIRFPNSDHPLDKDPDCMQRSLELLDEYAAEYLK